MPEVFAADDGTVAVVFDVGDGERGPAAPHLRAPREVLRFDVNGAEQVGLHRAGHSAPATTTMTMRTRTT